MRLLLDTHILLWALLKPSLLPAGAAGLIEDRGNSVYYSAASIWEIAIKSAQRRDTFPPGPDVVRSASALAGIQALAVTPAHASAVFDLPDHHRDPFDRMLIAQARCEPLLLLTADALLARYGDHVRVI